MLLTQTVNAAQLGMHRYGAPRDVRSLALYLLPLVVGNGCVYTRWELSLSAGPSSVAGPRRDVHQLPADFSWAETLPVQLKRQKLGEWLCCGPNALQFLSETLSGSG